MGLKAVWRALTRFFIQQHGTVKSFEHEVEEAGISGRVDEGMKVIPASKIVGSVGRSYNLRSDFFYRTGQAMTGRFVSIGKAMDAGKVLPPIEVYKAKLRRPQGDQEAARTEYYVVDGHHRVAMAKLKGQDFLDAHVVEYRVDPSAEQHGAASSPPAEPAAESSHAGAAPSPAPAPAPAPAPGAGPNRPEQTRTEPDRPQQGAAGH